MQRKLSGLFMLFLVLFFQTIFTGCDKEDNPSGGGDPLENELLTITLSENYLQNFSNQNRYAFAFLSDVNGEIIASEKLENSTSTTLTSIPFDGTETYHATIAEVTEKPDDGTQYFSIKTYLDIQPDDWTLDNSPINNSKYSTTYTLENVEVNEINLGGSGTFDGGSEPPFLKLNVLQRVGKAFASIRGNGESQFRYLLRENIDSDQEETIQFEDLPFIETVQNIRLPDVAGGNINVYGYTDQYKDKIQLIDESLWPNIPESIDIQIPEAVFDNFALSAYFRQSGDKEYGFNYYKVIPAELQLPDFNFDVSNNTPDSPTFQFNQNYSYFQASYFGVNGSQVINWEVFGAAEGTVTYTLPTLPENISNSFPGVELVDVEYKEVEVNDTFGDTDFQFFLEESFKNGKDINEVATKKFSLILKGN